VHRPDCIPAAPEAAHATPLKALAVGGLGCQPVGRRGDEALGELGGAAARPTAGDRLGEPAQRPAPWASLSMLEAPQVRA